MINKLNYDIRNSKEAEEVITDLEQEIERLKEYEKRKDKIYPHGLRRG